MSFPWLQRFGDNAGQQLDPNHASMLKSSVASGQHAGCFSHTSAFIVLSEMNIAAKSHSVSISCANVINW